MNNEWDEYAKGWDTDPLVKTYATLAFTELIKQVDLSRLTVLDFGCGTGDLTKLISPEVSRVVAIDPSSEMIKFLDKKALNNVSTVSHFLSKELINSNSAFEHKFDLILASSVCSFLPDYESTLALLKSLLTANGVFIQWDWLSEDESSNTGLPLKRVEKAFESLRFSDINITTPFTIKSAKGNLPVLMARGKNA